MNWTRNNYRPKGPPPGGFPPTADEVPGCPPHYWRLDPKWQECKKCGERQELPSPYAKQ